MGFVVFLLELTAVVVLPIAALFYGYRALVWGFGRHPAATALTLVLLYVLLNVAWMAFGRLFPGCTAFPAFAAPSFKMNCHH